MLNRQQAHKRKVRVIAVILLLLEIGIMFAYGFASTIDMSFTTTNPNSDKSYLLVLYIGVALFAIVGWGLIIAYSQNSAISGLTITLMVIGLTVQLFPLLYQFWNYCFNGWSGVFSVSLKDLTTSMLACTSIMVAFCFLSGRLSIVETFILIIIFNIGVALNINFLFYLFNKKWTNQIEIFDSSGTNYIFVYACCAALTVSIILNCKGGVKPAQTGSRHSAYIGMIGTGFAFASFPLITQSYTTIIGIYQSSMNIYFALTASVIMTYWSSAAFGGLKIGVRESLVGVLGGGVMIAVVSAYINNIGGCIAIGAFSGLVSGLWLRQGYPRMNANKPYDPLGLTGPILINAFLGAAGVGPILMGAYKSIGLLPNQMQKLITTQRSSTFYLTIFIVSVCVGIGTGLIGGLICYLTRDVQNDFQFNKMVSKDFGLYDEEDRKKDIHQAPQSNNQLQSRNML